MKTFAIDNDNNITAYATPEQVPEGHAKFIGEKELAKISAEWPASRMVEIWNTLPSATPVKKFTDRKTAVIRIVKAIQSLEATPEPPAAEPEFASETAPPADTVKPAARDGSKKAQVVAMLRQPQGSSLQEIMAATGWKAHTVRGFVSGTLVKKSGLKVESYKRSNGDRAYLIAAE